MGYLYVAIIVLLITGTIVLIAKKSWFQVLPLTLFIVIGILYFAGIFHFLMGGLYIILGIAFLSLIFLLLKRKKVIVLWNYELIAFLVIVLFFYVVHIGRGLIHGDEYTHWALTVKNMFCIDLLGSSVKSITSYKDYPPATALLEWMIMKLDGRYTEANLFRGISLLCAVIVISFTKPLIEKCQKKKYLILTSALLFPTMFFYLYTETLVDSLLGLLMGYILYQYFQGDNDKFRIILIGIATFILTITKSSGGGIAVLLIVIIVIDAFCNKMSKDSLLCGAVVGIGLLIGKFSWKWSLWHEQSMLQWEVSKITPANALELVKNFDSDRKATLFQYMHDYVYPNTSLNLVSLSYVTWFAALVFLIVYFGKSRFANRKRTIGLLISVILSLCVYSITLLLLYFFIWGQALTDGSFYRYMNSAFLGFIISFTFLAFQTVLETNTKIGSKLPIIMILTAILFCRPYEIYKLATFPVNAIKGNKSEYASIVDFNLDVKPENLIVIGIVDDAKMNYKYIPYRYLSVKDEKSMKAVIQQSSAEYLCIMDTLEWDDDLKPEIVYEIKRKGSLGEYQLLQRGE